MACSSESQSNNESTRNPTNGLNTSAVPLDIETKSPPPDLSSTQQRLYSKDHLKAFDLLGSPIWVFEIENKAMWWANEAACYLWSATDSESLTQRDFASDMSKRSLDNLLEKFALGEDSRVTRTFHPNGGKDGPKICDLLMSGIWVSKSGLEEDKQFCNLVVVEKVTDGKSVTSEPPVIIHSDGDITKSMEAAKEEADKQNMKRNEFFAVMAHEIRTPLHEVVGSIKLLAESGDLNAQQAESMNTLRTSADGLLTKINDLSDFTNLEAGKMKIETVPFEVRGVLEGSLAYMQPQAEKKGLAASCEIDQGVPISLMGDPTRLKQVVLNMLSNAVKFTSHGRVNLESKTMPQEDGSIRLRFTVADTGIGISKEECEWIFNPYQHADVSASRNYWDTGLGLAICKSLVETMGGEIGVDSVVGEGSTFWFEIPFALYVKPQAPVAKDADLEEISGLEVLVAEDNKMNQKVVVRMLQRLGHHPTVVENGEECVAEITSSSKKYDIILMDWQMPVMDGIDATKELRLKGYNMSDLPIVGLTASVNFFDFFDLGMNDCLKKPVRILDLKAALIKNVSVAPLA